MNDEMKIILEQLIRNVEDLYKTVRRLEKSIEDVRREKSKDTFLFFDNPKYIKITKIIAVSIVVVDAFLDLLGYHMPNLSHLSDFLNYI